MNTEFNSELAIKALQGGYLPSEIENLTSTQRSVIIKLANYLLDKVHPTGGPKAVWFEQALGFNQANFAGLGRQIVFDLSTAIVTTINTFGVKYNQMITVAGVNGRTVNVLFVWIRENDGIIRLVTAVPTKR